MDFFVYPIAVLIVLFLIGLVINWVFWPGDHERQVESSHQIWRSLNTPLPQRTQFSWLMTVLLAGATMFIIWNQYQTNPRMAGHYLLTISLMCTVVGLASFSKRERARTKVTLSSTHPELAAQIGKPEFEQKYRKRGYAILVFGLVTFFLWTQLFGLSSLSTY